MKAMILAAGLGTRLGPLTETTPKALVKIGGKTMLEWAILQLRFYGISEIIINVHHHSRQLLDFIKMLPFKSIRFGISDESGILLDTGGGLKYAAWFFDDGHPFVLHNVDVISLVNLREMMIHHSESGALATLAVSRRDSSRYFLFDSQMRLAGWEQPSVNKAVHLNDPAKTDRLAFSGIHVIHPEIFDLITEEGRFSLVDAYLRLGRDHLINGFLHSPQDWIDMGKPADLDRAEAMILNGWMDHLGRNEVG